jgi:antitoxin ParD1/3/4
MATRNLVLTERQNKMIDKLVHTGEYQNASEVMREALRLLEERRTRQKAELKILREAARVGIASLERGAYKEFASFDDLDEYLRRIAEEEIAATKRR